MANEKCIGNLQQHKNKIADLWSEISADLQVSKKDIASLYSATVGEIGEILKDMLGEDRYREIVRLKRQAFFSKVGKSRKNSYGCHGGSSIELAIEIKAKRERLMQSTRQIGDFSEDEMMDIRCRLFSRISHLFS